MKLKQDFHPRLFGFAGFSGSGKTTLIEKIIKRLSDYRIGYIKHDAHRFEIDHEGKDTYRQFTAGARLVYINDEDHFALQGRGESFTLEKEFFKDCDLVMVEGHKYADHPKFLFLDGEGEARGEYLAGKISGVVATIARSTQEGLPGLPSFERDDVAGITSFMLQEMRKSLDKVELFGLVLAGGASSRMGQDKSRLNYHGKPQVQYLYELLKELGIMSFLSVRQEQHLNGHEEMPVITDRFLNFGPLGGLLSAMSEHPNKALLVIACDLPLVKFTHLQELLEQRDSLRQATAYFNRERKMFEPLFAIYEPSIYSRLLHFLGERVTCPQKVLFNSSVKRLELPTQDFLFNANTPEEGRMALEQLGRSL